MQRPASSVLLRLPYALVFTALLALPFLFVAIPPLSDVPGHMGRAAVAAFAPTDPVLARLLTFQWTLVPNLGGDLIVAALDHVVSVTRAYWMVAAMIPVLFASGIIMLARSINPRGAASISWALVFIYSYPYNFGFINYMLGAAGALIGLSAWIRLGARPYAREAFAWVYLPMLFLCHAVAGCLFALFVASREFSELWPQPGWFRRLLHRCRPLFAAFLLLLIWRLRVHSFVGGNRGPTIAEKLNAVLMILRDQNIVLDIASVAAAIVVFAIAWRAGARPHRAVVPALLALLVLFVIMPPGIGGAFYADMRLLPLIPMLAFATQDWSGLPPRLVRFVSVAGTVLLLTRLGVTTLGFVAYDASYRAEAQALEHIPEHSRVLVLVGDECNKPNAWRKPRLGHFGDLAIVYRRSWTNSEWDTDGAHLLRVLYRPSPVFYDDPSQYVWPEYCAKLPPDHRTIGTALSLIPYDGIDDLWVIDAPLPPGFVDPRLRLTWQHGNSTVFAVVPASTGTPLPP